ncbi:MAG: hypothetical protein DRI94_07580, partial [Bacteroidetes bacterium]
LKNFETLKNIIQNDTNYLHKAKFYFLDFILSSKLKKSTDFDTNTTYNYAIIDTTKNINNLINIANQLTLDGNTEKSIKLLNKAISLCKSKDSLNYINTININLAEAYRKNFEYKKAIYLLNNVIYNKDVSQKELAHAYNRISANYNEYLKFGINRNDSIKKYSLLSLKVAKRVNDTALIASSQNELGYFFLKEDINYKKSETFFINSFNNYKKINAYENVFDVLINLSNLYIITNQNAKALNTILKGFDFFSHNTSNNICARFFLQLANIYSHNKMYYSAYNYLSLGRKIQEQIFKNKLKSNSLDLIAKYNLKLKESELEKAKQQSLKERQKKILIALILILTLLALIFIIFNNRLKIKLQKQREHGLELKNLNLKKKNEYKKLELSHALANIVKQNNTLKYIKLLLKNKEITKAINTINININIDTNLQAFLKNFNEIYPNFFENIEQKHPNITKTEKRLSALLLMNLKSQEIANILCVALSTVNKNRQRLRKKLNLPINSDITQYLKGYIDD